MVPLCSLFLLLPVTVTCTVISYLRVVNIFYFKARLGNFEVISRSMASTKTTVVQKRSDHQPSILTGWTYKIKLSIALTLKLCFETQFAITPTCFCLGLSPSGSYRTSIKQIWYIWYYIWYMWYDVVWCMIYDIWYDIYLLTTIGLTPGGNSTVHIYTQTIHRTTQSTQTIHRTTQFTN